MSILHLGPPFASSSPLFLGSHHRTLKKPFSLLLHTTTLYNGNKSTLSTVKNNSFRNSKISHLRIFCSAAVSGEVGTVSLGLNFVNLRFVSVFL